MKLDNNTKNCIRRAIYDVHISSNSEDKYWKWYTTKLCNELEKQFPGKDVLSCEEIKSRVPPSVLICGVCVIEIKNNDRKGFDCSTNSLITTNVEELMLPGVLVNFAHGRNPSVYWYYLGHQNTAVKENNEDEIILSRPENPARQQDNRSKIFPRVALGAAAVVLESLRWQWAFGHAETLAGTNEANDCI